MGLTIGIAVSSGPTVASNCNHCHQQLGERQVWFDRRVQVAFFGADSISIQVLSSDNAKELCDLSCWEEHQPEVRDSMHLTYLYPDFEAVTPCCRCGAPVDRQVAHVSYVLMDVTKNDKPWLKSCAVHSDEEYAVLCRDCETPAFELEDKVTEVQDVATEKSQGAIGCPVENADVLAV